MALALEYRPGRLRWEIRLPLLVAVTLVVMASSARAQELMGGGTLYSPIPGSYRAFGQAVAVDGDLVVVTDPGRVDPICATNCGGVHIYRNGGSGFAHEGSFYGEDDDRFGAAVDVSGTTIVVGASREPSGDRDGVGAAYVLEHGVGGWNRSLLARGYSEDQLLGAAIAIDGDLVAIGSPHLRCGGGSRCGSVLLMRRTGPGAFERVASLEPSVIEPDARFGFSLAIDGTTVVVGARSESRGMGAVYVFDESIPGSWTETERLVPPGATPSGPRDFGWDVDIRGDLIGVAVQGRSDDAGHVYERTGERWVHEAALGASEEVRASAVVVVGEEWVGLQTRVYAREGDVWMPGRELFLVTSADYAHPWLVRGLRTIPKSASVARVDLRFMGDMCERDRQCTTGMCVSRRCCSDPCLPADAGVDGGLDASVPDSGPPDGGSVDAGTVTDAGTVIDAGVLTDGGALDGGALDGGALDGGARLDASARLDAGSGLLDSGQGMDSGPTDGGADQDAATRPRVPRDTGCACDVAPGSKPPPIEALPLLMLPWLLRWRRAARPTSQ